MNNKQISAHDIKFRNSIDGLWDLALGLAFILVGLAFLFDAVSIAGGLSFSIFLLVLGLKQKIVYPRIGYVEHRGMNTKTRKTMSLTLIIGIVMLIAAFFVYLKVGSGENSDTIRSIVSNYGGTILGTVIVLVLLTLAKMFFITRFYWYSPLIFLGFLLITIINYEYIIPISFLSCGGIIFIIGLVILLKFIKKYPKLEVKEND